MVSGILFDVAVVSRYPPGLLSVPVAMHRITHSSFDFDGRLSRAVSHSSGATSRRQSRHRTLLFYLHRSHVLLCLQTNRPREIISFSQLPHTPSTSPRLSNSLQRVSTLPFRRRGSLWTILLPPFRGASGFAEISPLIRFEFRPCSHFPLAPPCHSLLPANWRACLLVFEGIRFYFLWSRVFGLLPRWVRRSL